MQWRSNQTREAEPMGYVFECGDQHQGQLLKEGTDFAQTAPIFRTKTQATPLQAADFITYEQFKATTTILDLKVDQLFLRFRTSFQRLLRVPFHHGNVEETNLRVFCRRYDIPKRLS
jgi:hypothetical protein